MLPTHAALIYAHWIFTVLSFVLCCLSPLNHLPGDRKPYPPERCQIVTVATPDRTNAKKCSSQREDCKPQAQYKDSAVGAPDEPMLTSSNERRKTKVRAPCPEEFVSHASYLTYMWLLPYVTFVLQS